MCIKHISLSFFLHNDLIKCGHPYLYKAQSSPQLARYTASKGKSQGFNVSSHALKPGTPAVREVAGDREH